MYHKIREFHKNIFILIKQGTITYNYTRINEICLNMQTEKKWFCFAQKIYQKQLLQALIISHIFENIQITSHKTHIRNQHKILSKTDKHNYLPIYLKGTEK